MNQPAHYRRPRHNGPDNNSGYVLGVILLLAGGLLFASKSGYWVPRWIFTWPMILIVVGVVVGAKHRFRGGGWIWPLVIGLFFLMEDIFPEFFPREYFWPFMLVLAGLFLIFRPRGGCHNWGSHRRGAYPGKAGATGPDTEGNSDESGYTSYSNINTDRLDESHVFASSRKVVNTQNFQGGEASVVFGSSEINLLQADFQVPPRLELNAIFGSIKLVVPSHWQLKMENSAVLGGVQDKRPQHSIYSDKILYLEANAVFGGIEITTV